MTYTAKPGTNPARLIDYLRRQPPGTSINLTEAFSVLRLAKRPEPNDFDAAVRAGLLLRSKRKPGIVYYRLPAAIEPAKRYSIGWPPGYERGSPYTGADITPPDNGAATSTHTAGMKAGGMQEIARGRGSLGHLGRSEESINRNEAVRRGTLR